MPSKRKRPKPKSVKSSDHEKKRKHSSKEAQSTRGSNKSQRIQSPGNERQMKSNPKSPDEAKSSSVSEPSRRSERIHSMGSPNYLETGRTYPNFGKKKKFKVQPHEFVCLYEVQNDGIPAYIKQGKKKSPVLSTDSRTGPYLIRASLNEQEQEKRLKCLSDCVEAYFKGLQLEDMTWFDTTSDPPERLKKCSTIVEEYGYKENDQFASIIFILRDIYFALLTGLNNGSARIAMSSIFDIPYLLLMGKSLRAVMNIGGSSSLNIVNGHCIDVVYDLDIFEASNKEVARKIMSVEEIEGVHHQVTPDVVLCKYDKAEVDFDKACKFYLFGECKCQTKLESSILMCQVFKQCLRGLLDYNTVYGCGFTDEGLFLNKLEIKSHLNRVIVAKEFYYFQDFYPEDQFNCKKFLDFMLCLTQIVKLHEFEY